MTGSDLAARAGRWSARHWKRGTWDLAWLCRPALGRGVGERRASRSASAQERPDRRGRGDLKPSTGV